MSRDKHTDMTAEKAADLARGAYADKWVAVPGFPAPEDPIGNSHAQEQIGDGWMFTPTTSNIEKDPRLAQSLHRFVVSMDGTVSAVPYLYGREAAEAYLVRT